MAGAAAGGPAFTILHPGHLIDAPPRRRRLLLGVDDELLSAGAAPGGRGSAVPRADVARVAAVAALGLPEARNRSVDLAAAPEKEPADVTAVAAASADGGAADGGGGGPVVAGAEDDGDVVALFRRMLRNCAYGGEARL